VPLWFHDIGRPLLEWIGLLASLFVVSGCPTLVRVLL